MLENAGSNGASLVFGFMLTAAVISMWVMNTATTIMLLPIGLAVVSVVKTTVNYLSDEDLESFQLASITWYSLRGYHWGNVYFDRYWSKWYVGCFYGRQL